jgi:rhodanese-related sulfurtransferase
MIDDAAADALCVIDVRTPAERDGADGTAGAMLPGAERVVLEDIVGGTAYLPDPDSGPALLLACSHGTKALVALDFLYDRFEAVFCVDGGVAAWQAAGLPVVQARRDDAGTSGNSGGSF